MTFPEELDQPAIKFHLDLDSGEVYEQDDSGMWYLQGTIPGTGGGFPGDGNAPPQVTGLVLSVAHAQQPDGTFIPALVATWDVSPAPDVLTYEVWWADQDTYTPHQSVSVAGAVAGLYPVVGGATYWVKVRAHDADALVGPWSDELPDGEVKFIVAPGDDVAPPIPDAPTVLPGYRMLGVTWQPTTARDLDRYELRWQSVDPVLPIDPANPPEVGLLSTKSNGVAITGLKDVTRYWASVRAVDRSNNVTLPGVSPDPDTAVNAGAYPDIGWSGWSEPQTTTLIPAGALAVDNMWITMLNGTSINADYIKTGTLSVGKTGIAGAIHVFTEGGVLQGTWDKAGMLMVDPFNVQKAMWLQGGSLYFSEDFGVLSGTDWVPAAVNGSDWPKAAADTLSTGRWKTAITPSGINVEALTFGSILSGSNLILNAGCELVTFTSALDGSKLWDLTTDWDDVLGGTNINLDVSTGDLRLTTV